MSLFGVMTAVSSGVATLVLVLDFVERRLELPRVLVHGILLHDRIIHHER